jgi:apolipoprotein N-acyltransferase
LHIIGITSFIAWLVWIMIWIGQGCPIPKWIHIFAGILLFIGVTAFVTLGVINTFSFKLVILCIITPPGSVYIGWLMFGIQEIQERD